MECLSLYSPSTPPFPASTFPSSFPPIRVRPSSSSSPSSLFPSLSTFSCKSSCTGRPEPEGELPLSAASASAVLGVAPGCSSAELKAAFRSKVKQFHPDVRRKDRGVSDIVIRRVIHAYEFLSNIHRSEIVESYQEFFDPFEDPECEAFDIFVNEVLCVGKGCPYSCVKRASHAFTFAPPTGTARARCQGHGEDYQVQLAVGQCPRSCIHYVTPSQRVILEELLDSILNVPYDTTAEADLLYSLVVKARFENNRYRNPKKQPKASTSIHVDWL